jgi:hypothetical protein
MSSLMMALVRRNMQERLTRHHNKVIILMHLLVFYERIIVFSIKQQLFRVPQSAPLLQNLMPYYKRECLTKNEPKATRPLS